MLPIWPEKTQPQRELRGAQPRGRRLISVLRRARSGAEIQPNDNRPRWGGFTNSAFQDIPPWPRSRPREAHVPCRTAPEGRYRKMTKKTPILRMEGILLAL